MERGRKRVLRFRYERAILLVGGQAGRCDEDCVLQVSEAVLRHRFFRVETRLVHLLLLEFDQDVVRQLRLFICQSGLLVRQIRFIIGQFGFFIRELRFFVRQFLHAGRNVRVVDTEAGAGNRENGGRNGADQDVPL